MSLYFWMRDFWPKIVGVGWNLGLVLRVRRQCLRNYLILGRVVGNFCFSLGEVRREVWVG